jgi:hypothetical protein
MFDDVTLARYARDAAETDAGSAGMRPAEGYAARAGAGRLSRDADRRSFVDHRQQRLDADRAAGREHFASMTVERRCACGVVFRTLRFAPPHVSCFACSSAPLVRRPQRFAVVVEDDDA